MRTRHARIIRSAIMARCEPELIAECGHSVMDAERMWVFTRERFRLWERSELFRRAFRRTRISRRTFRTTLSGGPVRVHGCSVPQPRTSDA